MLTNKLGGEKENREDKADERRTSEGGKGALCSVFLFACETTHEASESGGGP